MVLSCSFLKSKFDRGVGVIKAPRQPSRLWRRQARGAIFGLGLLLAASDTVVADPQIVAAAYTEATGRYDHLVLGKNHNWAGLEVRLSDGTRQTVTHSRSVFEDTAPRLVDLDGDGAREVITVESNSSVGARLAIYGIADGKLVLKAASPAIGRSHRWLAVVGAVDLDGDGRVEIAYVDRPHLAKTLRVWTYDSPSNPRLVARSSLSGVTNHRIGSPVIEGGIRHCDGRSEMVVASGDWARMLAISFDGQTFTSRDLGRYTDAVGLATAVECR